MQEETTQKTIAFAIKTTKLTASVLQKAMKMYLEHRRAQGAFPWEDFREKAGWSGRWGKVHRGHG